MSVLRYITMILLNRLEKEILQAICRQTDAVSGAIVAQLKGATVQARKNTGAGFYTTLDPNRSARPLQKDLVIGDVAAKVNGLKNPMVFLLFTKNGYADFLCSNRRQHSWN
jgi:hypothetical protein